MDDKRMRIEAVVSRIRTVLYRFHGFKTEVSTAELKAILGPSLYEKVTEEE